MILKWYNKTINGYVKYKSLEAVNILKIDDYLVNKEPQAAIAVSDDKGRGEIILFAKFADRDKTFEKIISHKKDQAKDLCLDYLDMYPNVLEDDEAYFELAKQRANLLEVPKLIKQLNVPNVMLLDAVKILRQDRAELFIKEKLDSPLDLIIARRFDHVPDRVHFIASVWTLCLPIPKKFHKIHVNANQYFNFVLRNPL